MRIFLQEHTFYYFISNTMLDLYSSVIERWSCQVGLHTYIQYTNSHINHPLVHSPIIFYLYLIIVRIVHTRTWIKNIDWNVLLWFIFIFIYMHKCRAGFYAGILILYNFWKCGPIHLRDNEIKCFVKCYDRSFLGWEGPNFL